MSITHKLIHNDYACREIGLIKCSLDSDVGGHDEICSLRGILTVVTAAGWLVTLEGAQSLIVDKRGGNNDGIMGQENGAASGLVFIDGTGDIEGLFG